MDYFFSDEYWNFYEIMTEYNGVRKSSMDDRDWNILIGKIGFFYYPQYQPFVAPDQFRQDGSPNPQYDHHMKNNVNNQTVIGIPNVNQTGNLERWSALTNELQSFTERSMDEFITGRRPFSQWDAYTAELRRLGADEAVAQTQVWYNEAWK